MLQVAREQHAREPKEKDDQGRMPAAERRRDEQQDRNGEQRVQRREWFACHSHTKEEGRNSHRDGLRHADDFAAKASGAR